MGERAPYSEAQQRKAILLAAIFGWAGVVGTDVLAAGAAPDRFGLFLVAAVGLPISLLACWWIGGPVIRGAMRKPVSWGKAAAGGAKVAAIITLIMIFLGWLLFLGSNVQLGYGDKTQFRGGMPTLFGLGLLAQHVAILIAIGTGVGLLVRAAIGPANTDAERFD